MQDYRQDFSLAAKDLWISAVVFLKTLWRFLVTTMQLIMNPTPNQDVQTQTQPQDQHQPASPAPTRSGNSITEEQAVSCYEQFLLVYRGEKTIEQAIQKPVQLGMNENSAKRYIAATLKGLVDGKTYKSSVNLRDQALFLNFIERDFEKSGLKRAIEAYEGHVDYLENETGVNHPRRRAQLTEFKKRLT